MATVTQGRLVEVEAVEAPVVDRVPVGAEKTFRAYDPDQVLLMAPSIGDWVPDGHLARFVSDLVDEALDLSAIYASYDEERGFPPYDPRLMVKLLIYGYATATPSSRKLEERTHSDVAVRFLCANQHPDFRPIARFRKRHLDALAELFVQALRLCKQAGLVGLGTLALDGTKLRANASRHKAMSYERMVTARWSPGVGGYRTLARRVRAARPAAVFVAGDLAADGPQLIAALTSVLGRGVQLIAGDAFNQPAPLIEAAGSRVDGMLVSIAVLPNASLPPRGERFAAEFKKRFTQRPCCFSVHDAQATEILLDAIAKAGGRRARVARYVIGARVRHGLLGDFQIDRNGDTTLNTIGINQIRAGRLHFERAITPARELLGRP